MGVRRGSFPPENAAREAGPVTRKEETRADPDTTRVPNHLKSNLNKPNTLLKCHWNLVRVWPFQVGLEMARHPWFRGLAISSSRDGKVSTVLLFVEHAA